MPPTPAQPQSAPPGAPAPGFHPGADPDVVIPMPARVGAPELRDWLAGFIGGGLVTAALTDSCVMGSLRSRLPDNRDLEPGVRDVVDVLAR